jgi:TRAP-type C4-dicarboxylate transport system permease small subunit
MRLALNAIDWLLIRALILVVGVQLLCVIWQFVSRYVLGTPSTVTEEIAQLLLMWLGFLGAAHVLARRQHLAINLLGDLPPGPKRRIVSLIGIAWVAVFAGAVLADCIDMLPGGFGPEALGPTDPIDGSARIEEV